MKTNVCIDPLSPGQESYPQWIVAEFFLGLQTPLVWSLVHFVCSGLAKKDLTLIDSLFICFQSTLFMVSDLFLCFEIILAWAVLFCLFGRFQTTKDILVHILYAFETLKHFCFVLFSSVFEMYWLIIVWPLSPDITPQIEHFEFFCCLFCELAKPLA